MVWNLNNEMDFIVKTIHNERFSLRNVDINTDSVGVIKERIFDESKGVFYPERQVLIFRGRILTPDSLTLEDAGVPVDAHSLVLHYRGVSVGARRVGEKVASARLDSILSNTNVEEELKEDVPSGLTEVSMSGEEESVWAYFAEFESRIGEIVSSKGCIMDKFSLSGPPSVHRELKVYEEELMALLLQLDGVDVLGKDDLRTRRRGLVVFLNSVLTRIDESQQ